MVKKTAPTAAVNLKTKKVTQKSSQSSTSTAASANSQSVKAKKIQKKPQVIDIDCEEVTTKSLLPVIQPKKPLTAYIQFTCEKLAAKTKDLETLGHAERIKKLAEEWNKLSDKQKQKYVKLSEEDKARFNKETE